MINQFERLPRKYGLFLTLVCLTPVVELLASLTDFVTYINLGYRMLILSMCVAVSIGFPGIFRLSGRALILPVLYVAFFMIGSVYGVNLTYSIDYRLFLLPVILVDFLSWYLMGLICNEMAVTRRVYFFGAVYSIMSIALSLLSFVNVDLTRVISGPDVPVAVVASSVSFQPLYSALLIIASVASLKKTVVLCSVIGIVLTFVLLRIGGVATFKRRSRFRYFGFLQFSLLVGFIVPFLFVALPYIDQTISRFLVEREDYYRTAMTDEFYYLLDENFPWGTGYYTFGYLTQDTLPYVMSITPEGNEVLGGMSLHNSLMHVALEGGAPVLFTFLAIFGLSLLYGFRLYRQKETRALGTLMISWIAVCLMFGMTNQLHATHYYFGIVGFCFGAFDRLRRAQYPHGSAVPFNPSGLKA